MLTNQIAALTRTVERARWLAELNDALDQASRLARRMSAAADDGEQGREVRALRGQIAALAAAVDSFRRMPRFEAASIGPKRMY